MTKVGGEQENSSVYANTRIIASSLHTQPPHQLETISEADPDPWIRIRIIKVVSGTVWRDTNLDPGYIR